MATEVAVFNPANRPDLPAEMQAFFEEEANVVPRETINSLSYEGKTWAITLNGDKTKLMVTDKNTGDVTPLAVFRAVILDYNKRRGRAYYEGAYDPTKITMPVCWSDDGITPDESVTEKQHPTCKTCPKSIKGSKVTEQQKQVVACSEHRMIVLVPSARLNFEPLRLKIAITSDWDGQSPEHEAQGWYGFRNYVDMLVAKGIKHTAQLVTKMKFDPNTAYPKVLFAAEKWLEPAQLSEVVPLVKSEKVKQLVSGTWTPNGADAVQKALPAGQTTPDPQAGADELAKARAAKEAKGAADLKAKAEADARVLADAKAKAEAEALAAAQAKAAQVVEEDDGDAFPDLPGEVKAEAKPNGAKAPAATTKAAKAPAAAKAAAKPKAEAAPEVVPATPTTSGDNDISSLLDDWS